MKPKSTSKSSPKKSTSKAPAAKPKSKKGKDDDDDEDDVKKNFLPGQKHETPPEVSKNIKEIGIKVQLG